MSQDAYAIVATALNGLKAPSPLPPPKPDHRLGGLYYLCNNLVESYAAHAYPPTRILYVLQLIGFVQ
jgi:hypothetical protein